MSDAEWTFIYPQVLDATPSSEVDAMARMLFAETRGTRSERETAQIGHAAINRAREYQATVRDVVYNAIQPPKYARKRQVWNASGADWDAVMARADKSAQWMSLLTFATRVLSGQIPSEIGARTQFIHPGTQLERGRRIPDWMISRSQGGSARFEPIDIDGARFA